MYVQVSALIFKSWEQDACPCIFMPPPHPPAHLALVTASVTRVWLRSIPAPITPLWESRVMSECCCGSQDHWQHGCSLLCSRLEMASCWQVCCCGAFFSLFFFHLCLLRGMSEGSGGFIQTFTSPWRARLQKHWFTHFLSLLSLLTFTDVTAGHWFGLMWCPFE